MSDKPDIEPMAPGYELSLRFLQGDEGPVHLTVRYDEDTVFFLDLSWRQLSAKDPGGFKEVAQEGVYLPIAQARALHTFLGMILGDIDKGHIKPIER